MVLGAWSQWDSEKNVPTRGLGCRRSGLAVTVGWGPNIRGNTWRGGSEELLELGSISKSQVKARLGWGLEISGSTRLETGSRNQGLSQARVGDLRPEIAPS